MIDQDNDCYNPYQIQSNLQLTLDHCWLALIFTVSESEWTFNMLGRLIPFWLSIFTDPQSLRFHELTNQARKVVNLNIRWWMYVQFLSSTLFGDSVENEGQMIQKLIVKGREPGVWPKIEFNRAPAS